MVSVNLAILSSFFGGLLLPQAQPMTLAMTADPFDAITASSDMAGWPQLQKHERNESGSKSEVVRWPYQALLERSAWFKKCALMPSAVSVSMTVCTSGQ